MTQRERWTAAQIPDQSGRTAVVTGGNSGLGFVTARELARAGADVVIASRDLGKAERAVSQILAAAPSASARVSELDLGDLQSVRGFAARFADEHGRLDLLINNAGVMAPPRQLTKDGFESQFGINHLGHFALTGLLLEPLLSAPQPRVVTVSSGMHRMGKVNFDDLQAERRYNNWLAYGQSKLANLYFCFELQRRATLADWPLKSLASHPGYAATNLQSTGPARGYERTLLAWFNRFGAQTPEMGALPSLYAATIPQIAGASFVGPDGPLELRGYPHIVAASRRAYDSDAWRRLWEVSAQLTGVAFELPARR
jgi:NAD(P)-dependent dehydrogenase (short-subunit alcohol dehydrogenase family)